MSMVPREASQPVVARLEVANSSVVVSWPLRVAASSAPQAASIADGFGAVHRGRCCVTTKASTARHRVRSVAFVAGSSSRSSASDGPLGRL